MYGRFKRRCARVFAGRPAGLNIRSGSVAAAPRCKENRPSSHMHDRTTRRPLGVGSSRRNKVTVSSGYKALMQLVSNLPPRSAALMLACLSLLATVVHSSALDTVTPYRAKRLFYGCWTRTTTYPKRTRWPTSTSTWCFERGRMLGGLSFDAGDGWDYCERWHVRGQRLAAPSAYDDERECTYAFSGDRRTLILRDCTGAGDWQRDDASTETNRGSWKCRMQGRPEANEQP